MKKTNESKSSNFNNYTTYGEEWKKEMSKLPKNVIIDIAAKVGQDKERLEKMTKSLATNTAPGDPGI